MSTPYPDRSPFFAHKAFRIMHKASVAAEIGRDAFCIIAVVLHTEDAARYRGPVRFWNSQLMETLGFCKWETFDRARKKAIESGWLQYSGDGKRSAGLYFVTIPEAYSNVNDEPIEQVSYPQNGYKEGYDQGYKEGYEAGMIGGTKRGQSGVQSGDDMGEPYIPIPIPIPKDNIPEKKQPRQIDHETFDRFWKAYPKRTARGAAEKAWLKAVKIADPEKIIAGAGAYAEFCKVKDSEFIKNPATWLNAKCWDDEIEPPKKKQQFYWDMFPVGTPEGDKAVGEYFLSQVHT